MSYFGEFRAHWPNLLGGCLGIAFGAALSHYMTNLFGPPLIEEFGWEKSQFALIGVMSLATMLFLPLWGRFTDHFGARTAAGLGYAILPLTFLAFSFMSGNIVEFFVITFVQHVFSVLTATLTFTRVIVEKFDSARGMALSLVMTGAPLSGAILVPIVGAVIDAEGWRTAYRLLAVICAVGGIAALLLVGKTKGARHKRREAPAGAAPAVERSMLKDLRGLIRKPAFILIITGMFLCNFPQVIVSSQMKLVVMDSGASSQLATWIVSLYATGVVIGRFACGLALDKVPANVVSIFALGLPAVGFAMLASPFDAGWVLGGAILLVGLAQGAEGDIGAYMTSRNFDMEQYSFVFSFLTASMGLASAAGSIMLSLTLAASDSFNPFLIACAIATVLGALAFFLTGRLKPAHPEAHEPAVALEGPSPLIVGEEV